jgi:hypothetical protein
MLFSCGDGLGYGSQSPGSQAERLMLTIPGWPTARLIQAASKMALCQSVQYQSHLVKLFAHVNTGVD